MGILSEKKLLIGVSGGIASYKVCEVIRQLTDLGASIQVVLTKHAANFVTPLTFETLTNQPALTEMFPEDGMVATRHIDVPRMVDRLLICPATANLIGKIASGIADDLLSTMIMVAGAEKITVCPAMNTDMWFNPIAASWRLWSESFPE
jgi:phosphopantothenoylcysteine decarboxylase/phosphopantothenate--cysteine ligase